MTSTPTIATADLDAPARAPYETSAEEAPALPDLLAPLSMPLDEALSRRRSARAFDPTPLGGDEIARLLWAAQGVTSDAGHRTAPSFAAFHPLRCDVATEAGVFRYEPEAHALRHLSPDDVRPGIARAAPFQERALAAPAVFVLSFDARRTTAQFGEDRGRRFATLEAGHVAQNLLLEATALGLASVTVGSFEAGDVRDAAGLAADEEPLYLVAVGRPATTG